MMTALQTTEAPTTVGNDRSPVIEPQDEYNALLLSNAHPPDWVNPKPAGRYNLIVLGAGTAGLVAVSIAAALGAKVALIEKDLLGGDCLNTGCVPSKAIIRSSRSIRDTVEADVFGVKLPGEVRSNFELVMERMRKLRSHISRHDAANRFRAMGVDVFFGKARFAGLDSVRVGDRELRFSRAVIATGARAAHLRIEGLEKSGYFTNETVFSITKLPERLAVIGAGPVGCELAQAFRRLGSEVYLFHRSDCLLNREDEDASTLLQETFEAEGIHLFLDSRIHSVLTKGKAKLLSFQSRGNVGTIAVDAILAGVGRNPNVEDLGLEEAGVEYDRRQGVLVDDYLRTTNRRIYAAGDVCLNYKFTHAADATARIAVQNSLFLGRKKLSSLSIPRVTYTDPEIAQIGVIGKEARERRTAIDTFVRQMQEVDRAVLDGEERGFVKIHTARGTDKILGATIVARHAGEMINELSLAISNGLGLKAIANVIHPYPTQAEAIKQVADLYTRSRLSPLVKSLSASWLRAARSDAAGVFENFLTGVRKRILRILRSESRQT